jgi:hypothetical protein
MLQRTLNLDIQSRSELLFTFTEHHVSEDHQSESAPPSFTNLPQSPPRRFDDPDVSVEDRLTLPRGVFEVPKAPSLVIGRNVQAIRALVSKL